MSTLLPAARVEDPIHHNAGIAGFFVGAFVGAIAVVAIAVVTAATAGAGLVVLAAAGAIGGGAVGEIGARLCNSDGIHTGNLTEGAPNIFINGKPLVRMTDPVEPCWIPVIYAHGQTFVVEGSMTVVANCLPASRVDDEALCGAFVAKGSPNVFIGGPKGRIKGTEGSLLSFFLERLGISAFAVQAAIYPPSGFLTLAGIFTYHADYSTYKAINTNIAGGIKSATGVDVPQAFVGWGVETTIALLTGNVGNIFKKSPTATWSALKQADKAQAYSRYLNKPNTAGWSYSRWSKAWDVGYKTRIPSQLQNFENSLIGLRIMTGKPGSTGFAVGVLDGLQFVPAHIRAQIDAMRGAFGMAGGCNHDWYAPVE